MPFDADTLFNYLTDEITQIVQTSNYYRVLVMVIGRPGSGKSTVAEYLERKLNQLYESKPRTTVFSPEYCQIPSRSLLPENDRTRDLPMDLRSVQLEVESDIDNPDFEPLIYKGTRTVNVIGRGLLSTQIVTSLEEESKSRIPVFAQRISMDGFHLPRSVLEKTRDPDFMFQRRGFPASFDSGLVLNLVQQLTASCKGTELTLEGQKMNREGLFMFDSIDLPSISIPDFDHKLKDPTPGGSVILPTTRVIILEGNYLMLEEGKWAEIPEIVACNCDIIHVWKIRSKDLAAIRERTARRHVDAGISPTIDKGRERYDSNDKINGDLVDSHSMDKYVEMFIEN
ncbi:DEKNAAC100770 [Brettanomyces naardenensis]|uniref:DEKNAAC100770 n=1 Tax=Brettanomyces naardenensis TaxID=13370 RepID=A0A448YGN0_BRENA|nr:DEKNAAC100770 [Brettanomyces naardenensis]